ncbi:hypothetical protein LWI28_018901 [Acer negundo]|uniref:Uncharacterized protein n=1 Tax=Acer negundo TaxID=4023 RepID=A0AAD5IDC8_ACENE|nr:hypothetical protein LWI28_018901 [Acer negundo]
MEIALEVGIPLQLDQATRDQAYEFYARVLIDIDLTSNQPSFLNVERDDHRGLSMDIMYENLPKRFPPSLSLLSLLPLSALVSPRRRSWSSEMEVVRPSKVLVFHLRICDYVDGGALEKGAWVLSIASLEGCQMDLRLVFGEINSLTDSSKLIIVVDHEGFLHDHSCCIESHRLANSISLEDMLEIVSRLVTNLSPKQQQHQQSAASLKQTWSPLPK